MQGTPRTTGPHPFVLVFGGVAEEWFGPIRRVANAPDLGQFAKLGEVEAAMALMQGEAEDAEQGDELLRLLFAGYSYWRDGRHDRAVSMELLDPSLRSRAVLDPGYAQYIQVPIQRYWAQVSPESKHEPLDGLFVVPQASGRDMWLVLAVLGVRDERPGFSQVSALVSTTDFADIVSGREPPFAPVMSGGAAAGFFSITSTAELLWLARLALVSGEG